MIQEIFKEHNVNLICDSSEYSLYIGCHSLLVDVIVTSKYENGKEYIVRQFYMHRIEFPHDIDFILENDKRCNAIPQFAELNLFNYPTLVTKSVNDVFLKIGNGSGSAYNKVVLQVDKSEFYILTQACGFVDCVKDDIQLVRKLKIQLQDPKERLLVQRKIGLAELPFGYGAFDFSLQLETLCAFEIATNGNSVLDQNKLDFCRLYPEFIKTQNPISPQILKEFTADVLAIRNVSTTYELEKIYILSDTEYFVNGVYETIHINPTSLKDIFIKSADNHFPQGFLTDADLTEADIQKQLFDGLKKLSIMEQFVISKYSEIGVPLFVSLAFFDEIFTISELIDHLILYIDPAIKDHETLMWNGYMLNTFYGIMRKRYFN